MRSISARAAPPSFHAVPPPSRRWRPRRAAPPRSEPSAPASAGETPRITRLVSPNSSFAAAATSAAVMPGSSCLHEPALVLDARARLAFEEVVDVFLREVPALGLVALVVGALVGGDEPLLGAIELGRPETELLGAVRLHLQRGKPAAILPSWTARPGRTRRRPGSRPLSYAPASRNCASGFRDISSNRSLSIWDTSWSNEVAAIVRDRFFRFACALADERYRRLRRLGIGRHLDQQLRRAAAPCNTRAGAAVAGFGIGPNSFLISASISATSTSPTTTTAMRSGRYHFV